MAQHDGGLVTAIKNIKRRQKPPYTGVLLKPIYLDDSKPRGLRAALGAPADESDQLAHIEDALRARYAALDKFFGLESSSLDIWERRAKELIAHEFEITIDHPQWWRALTGYLVDAYVPGFSLTLPGQRKHGAPQEWDYWQLAQLFADIEYLKRKEHWSVRKICGELPKAKGYKQRWGRKAYSQANALRNKNTEFLLILSGGEWLIPTSGVDPIDAAIQRHGLKS